MEPKFQTSFIPKQPLAPMPGSVRRSSGSGRSFGLGTVIAMVIFIGAVAASIFVFLFQQYLTASIKSNEESLARAREAFEPALIKELGRLDDRIRAANQILDRHIAPSTLFALLEEVTLENVQFTSFTYGATTDTGEVEVSLEGKARSFKTIALQSDVLGANQYLRNTVVSDLKLDPSGNVAFIVTATVDPRLLSYLEKISSDPAPITDEPVIIEDIPSI